MASVSATHPCVGCGKEQGPDVLFCRPCWEKQLAEKIPPVGMTRNTPRTVKFYDLNENVRKSKRWHPLARKILKPYVDKHNEGRDATDHEDFKKTADVVFEQRIAVALRVRNTGFRAWHGEVTLTGRHETGAPGEWAKGIEDENMQWFLYGHEVERDNYGDMEPWFLVDVKVARDWLLNVWLPAEKLRRPVHTVHGDWGVSATQAGETGRNRAPKGVGCYFYALKMMDLWEAVPGALIDTSMRPWPPLPNEEDNHRNVARASEWVCWSALWDKAGRPQEFLDDPDGYAAACHWPHFPGSGSRSLRKPLRDAPLYLPGQR